MPVAQAARLPVLQVWMPALQAGLAGLAGWLVKAQLHAFRNNDNAT